MKDKKINNVPAGTLQTLRHSPTYRMAGKTAELTNSPKREREKERGHCASQEGSLECLE